MKPACTEHGCTLRFTETGHQPWCLERQREFKERFAIPMWMFDESICLDDGYLGHLREAAFDWANEPLDKEEVLARRAAIWLARNVVTLIDEVRRMR